MKAALLLGGAIAVIVAPSLGLAQASSTSWVSAVVITSPRPAR